VASATDNVYVNIIANTQGFTDKMKSALKPLRDFMQVVQGIMALGGAAMIINKIAQAVGDMEKAYAKLHPESQKAVGSLGQWNDAMANAKANQGALVSAVLTPIRAAFVSLIDPIGSATYELRQLQKAMQEISDKYLTTERKQYKDREDALRQLAEATKTYNDAVFKQSKLEAELIQRQKEYQKGQEAYKLSRLSSDAAGKDATSIPGLAAMNAASAAVDANRKLIAASLVAQRNIKEYLAASVEAAKETVKPITDVTDSERLMLDYLAKNVGLQAQRLELAQDYMDAMDQVYAAEAEASGVSRGSRGGSRGATSRSVGRATRGAAEETENAVEAAKELSIEWQTVADLVVTMSSALGEAFVTGDYLAAIKEMTAALLDFIAKEAIAAGLKMLLAGNIPLGIALLAIGGITLGVSAGVRSADMGAGYGGGHTVELPRMAAGGIVTKPTLAMIGEAGPEAVVPLGRGGGGGMTVIVQGSIWQTEDLAVAIAREQARW